MVEDKGLNKFLSYHNLTKTFELVENNSTLNVNHQWQWNVETADNGGWSKISNTENGLFLTTKYINRTSIITLENEGMSASIFY